MDIKDYQCKFCRFWVSTSASGPNGGTAPCVRFPPTVVVVTKAQGPSSIYPLTGPNNYCGEWKRGRNELNNEHRHPYVINPHTD